MFGKWLRLFLNLLFWLVLIAGVVMGRNMEDKDPESFFPGFFDSPSSQTAPNNAPATPPKAQ